MTSSSLSVVIAGGGTAGHIEPALAVAQALRDDHHARITAIGTKRGLESEIIPSRGVDLEFITAVPIPRKLSASMLALPFKVLRSIRQAREILKHAQADAVFGTGGYVSASAYLAAKSLGVPFYIHESNAKAGLANKLGVRLGGVGFNAVQGSGMPGEVVGVPVRAELARPEHTAQATARAREMFGLVDSRPTILVTGGSQGAATINQAVAGAVDVLVDDGCQILHAYGKRNQPPQPHKHYVPLPYIENMAAALAVADVVVCRSGAMTVAEVSASAVPAIYVPLPHGNGEQGLNCAEVVRKGAALSIADSEFTGRAMVEAVSAIIHYPQRMEEMRRAAESSRSADAAQRLAQRIAFDVGALSGEDPSGNNDEVNN